MYQRYLIAALLLGGALSGCNNRDEAAEIALEVLDIDVCAPDQGPFSADVDNPYFPLPVGRTLVLEGEEEDDGETVTVTVVIEVLDETELVAGVFTRVVEVSEFEDDELFEISHDYYAQAPDGTVCYYGEDVDIYVDGEVVANTGSWRAGEGDNAPGIIMPGDPQPDTEFAQESAPGIAEDRSAIVAVGVAVSTAAGDFDDAVHAVDWNPLEEETFDDAEDKFYARDVGLVVDDVVELIERIDPL